MTDGPLLWYLNRGTGVVALVLLTLTTVLGVLATRRPPGRRRAALRHPGPAPQPRAARRWLLLGVHV